ncbi:phage tail-collar fiber domain-containing protein [Pseudomonas hamedanensis]|uniref:Phage tail protein n=1 Tax=Pseudomonas hamedanensis TaxID=2745504 RepID=A0A9E6P552_9PSED|nr:phage tail protein [Pseudomonas hamedanensis]QXI19645.1 phage tail protein [Pseudomonas hamedanensis]
MADYYTLLTNAGIAYETACKAAGVPIKLTQISVGDGGEGGVYNPAATATALKREVWRGPLNALFQDEKNPSWLLAEVTIPPDVGGWYVREAGLWTDTGILYAIVKYPESFKPVLASSGSGKEFYIRSIFETSNASLVTLSIDDTVVKATRAWVMSYLAEELGKLDGKQSVRVAATGNVPLKGAQQIDGVAVVAGDRVLLPGQTLAKDNGLWIVANGDWLRATDANSSAKVTPGLTVMVEEGTANGDSLWHLTTNAPITLGTTALTFKMLAGRTGIAAGTYKSLTVDEYGRATAGANPETLAGFGIKDSYTKAEVEALIAKASALPVGSIVAFPVEAPPPGFLELDNSVKSSATYPDLSAYLGDKFNKGDEGVGNFRLPEARGEFLRGWDHGRGVDTGRAIGSWQTDTLKTHSHYLPTGSGGGQSVDPNGEIPSVVLKDTTADWALRSTFGGDNAELPIGSVRTYNLGSATETRPRNIAVMWCIKAWNAAVNQGNIDIAALAVIAEQATELNQGTAKIATQAQTESGTDDKTVVTPKKMRWGFSIGISENLGSSYVVFPTWLGGLIIQWGMTNAIASGANYLQAFPVAFPLYVPAVFTTYPNAAVDAPTGSTYIGQVRAQSKANVTIRNIGPTPAQFYFLAIGR